MNGSVNSRSSGRSTALNRLSSTTTTTSVEPPSQRMPGTIRVAISTPSARISHRASKFRMEGGMA